MRILVIGDIHSGVRALHQLLERAKVRADDRLIFLGDYVDGWSQAVETIDFLIELREIYDCTFIRGNHDELCYEWLGKGKDNPLWFEHGGKATWNSYARADEATKIRHIDFYERLKDFYIDDRNRLFLYAGFTNLKGVHHEYFPEMFYWDRTLWELALSLNPTLKVTDVQYPKRLLQYHEIYIGHTPVTKIGLTKPHNAANIWNMDTGAAFMGPLSMMDIDTKQIWQSDPVHLLYPLEKGRN